MPSLKKLPLIVLTALFLLYGGAVVAQSKKLKKADQPISSSQADTVKSKGIYGATVYFSGNGLPYVKVFSYFDTDLNRLMKRIDSASNGAIVSVDDLRFIDPDGKITMNIKEIPYKFNRPRDTVKSKHRAVLQVDELKAYHFVSGTIYFYGFGFNGTSSSRASDTSTLYKYYNRSGPGTIITLDNCIYKNANGSLSNPLSKSVKLE